MWCLETGRGTSAHWADRLNPGGIGVTDAWDAGLGWTSGADAAGAMMAHLSAYVRGYDHALWKCIRLDPRYTAPLVAGYGASVTTLADLGNGRWATDPQYAGKAAGHVAALRAQDARPQPTPAAPGKAPLPPTVERWSPNSHDRGGQQPVAIVYHMTDSDWASADAWFANPASRASSHVIIDRDGTIYRYVSSLRAAWTNGKVERWNRAIPWIGEAVATGRNLNDFTLAIEHAATRDSGFTRAQVDATVALSRYWLERYGIRPCRGSMVRHADIDGRDRPYCPGEAFPLGEVIRRCGGDPEDFAWGVRGNG